MTKIIPTEGRNPWAELDEKSQARFLEGLPAMKAEILEMLTAGAAFPDECLAEITAFVEVQISQIRPDQRYDHVIDIAEKTTEAMRKGAMPLTAAFVAAKKKKG